MVPVFGVCLTQGSNVDKFHILAPRVIVTLKWYNTIQKYLHNDVDEWKCLANKQLLDWKPE